MHTYLFLLHETPADYAGMSPAEMEAILHAHQAFVASLAERGLIVGGEKLADDGGRHLRRQGGPGGQIVASDGPYAEAHEVIGGFYMVKAADDAAAEALARECPHFNGRQWIEIRRIDPM